jgi:integrase
MAKRVSLNERTVKALACPAGARDALVFDTSLKGFAVRIQEGGGKWFVLQYRIGGIRRRLSLGEWGVVTVAEARGRAERARGIVADGRDPWAERREEQTAARAAEAEVRRKASEEAYTVERMVDDWCTFAEQRGRRASYITEVRRRMRYSFVGWRERPASSIAKAEVIHALDHVAKSSGSTSARRALAYGRACYNWAVKRDALAFNPFAGVPAHGAERSRDRVLSDAEIAAVWNGAAKLPPAYCGAVRVLMLTGQRLSEVAKLRWCELSDDLALWTLPADRAKNGKAHIVHLTEPAREILRGLVRFKGSDLVFTEDGKKPISSWSHTKIDLDAASGVSGWVLHDFRRTMVTVLAGMGIPPHVADRLLNHVTGTIRGVAAVYQRNEFLPNRKRALQTWADHVKACAAEQPRPQKVIMFPDRQPPAA